MLVKDILVDLESGDLTKEFLDDKKHTADSFDFNSFARSGLAGASMNARAQQQQMAQAYYAAASGGFGNARR